MTVFRFAVALILTITMIAWSAWGSGEESTCKTESPQNGQQGEQMNSNDYRQIGFKTISGNDSSLTAFDGKVTLIVNTASECGFTPQYEGLQKLYERFKDSGLVIVGFPANNFGQQEPGSNEQIAAFCKLNFGVTFPMMAKVSVKGKDKHPLFSYLTEKSPFPGEIKWNFGKFLLDRQGKVVARFDSGVSPDDDELVNKIEKLL